VNNAIQQTVDDKLRGRVSAIYIMVFFGAMPLGSLLAGWTSEHVGPVITLASAGAACVGTALVLYLRLVLQKRAARGTVS
jgi:predicted MFS family arabinose efflux permease